jgi:hydrogenase nickel incorporation protein HypA/HybF
MHEFSLVRSLIGQVAQIAIEHDGGVVKAIHLKCGSLAGVEPALVSSAFELMRAEHKLEVAVLVIEEVSLEANCLACNQQFYPVAFRFTCPNCGSGDTKIVQGESLILESVELEAKAEVELI